MRPLLPSKTSCWWRGSGFGLWASGFGFRGSGFGIRVTGFGIGFRASDLGFWASGFGVRGAGFRVQGFGFQGAGCTVSGGRVRVAGCRVSGIRGSDNTLFRTEGCSRRKERERERVLLRQSTGPNLSHHRDDHVDRPRAIGLTFLFQLALYLHS